MKKIESGIIGLKANFCNGYNFVKMLPTDHLSKEDLKIITDYERQIAEYTRHIYECLYVEPKEDVKEKANAAIEEVKFLLKDGTEKIVSEDIIQEMEIKYKKSGVNVREEIRKMSVWTHDKKNASNRKTSRGTKAFMTRWLDRASVRK